jgi:proteic killer suppression protein
VIKAFRHGGLERFYRTGGRWSITVNGNWRLTFGFEGTDVLLLDYEDYH